MAFTRREFLRYGLTATSLAGFLGCKSEKKGEIERKRSSPEIYDVCIVGTGFAGTFLGLRLVKHRVRTIMLEAGSSLNDTSGRRNRARSFQFTNSGEIDYLINSTRFIGLGGTSNLWSGILNRLRPSDFQMQSRFGMYVDWPITYKDLEPYYCQAETALGAIGFPPVKDAEPHRTCAYPYEQNQKYEGPKLKFNGHEPSFFQIARTGRQGKFERIRLANIEIPDFRSSPYGTLLTDHQVTRLVTQDGKNIEYIETTRPDGTKRKIYSKKFILAAGVVESARLLLLSKSQWYPKGIGNNYDLVGRFFNEHPAFLSMFKLNPKYSFSTLGNHRTYYYNDRFRKEGLNAAHFQIFLNPHGNAKLKAQPEVEPYPDNRITLSESLSDGFGSPVPNLHFSYSGRDKLTIKKMMHIHKTQENLLAKEPDKIKRMEKWRGHPSGVCRMGFDEKTGVVDLNSKVFGLDNIYVSGAGIFPTAGTSNPTLTIVAMTLRLANHLIMQLTKGQTKLNHDKLAV